MTLKRNPVNNHTKQRLDDSCVHDWYRFVLAFPDHLVTDILERWNVLRGHTVLDPFVGTGTTLVECKKRGIHSIGIDSNPVAAFASQVKTAWDIDLSEFDHRCRIFLHHLQRSLVESFSLTPRQLAFDDIGADVRLTDDAVFSEPLIDIDAFRSLLSKDAVSDLPLRKILLAKQILDFLPQDPITDVLRLGLISVAVKDLSNLGFGPEVYVKRNKRLDGDIYGALRVKYQKIRRDMEIVQGIHPHGSIEVYGGDARELGSIVHSPVDFVITSPPYPNEKDYTRTTRLELVLLDFMQDRKGLRQIKEEMLRSHTRNIFEADNDSAYVKDMPEITSLAHQIEEQRVARGATSGFERLYHRVVTEYFGGMYRVLDQLRTVVPVGGKVALVVGDQTSYFQIPIRTAALLSLIANRKLGYSEVETLLWRTRLATATRHNVEENILILERQ